MGRAIALAMAVGAVFVTACSSSGSSSGGTVAGEDAGDAATAEAAAPDAAAATVNNCKTFDDRTAASASRTIAWGIPLAAAERCMEIKVGQSVTWSGNFQMYGVAASGGDKPNPIASFDPATPTVKFPKAGTFGFESPDAPALVGAVHVTE